MRIAFGIVSLFPGGGLQRDCIEIAKLVRDQGHDVVIHACRLRDFTPSDEIPVVALQNDKRTNHERQFRFATDFLAATANYDLTVGFDKLINLDILYCADASIARRMSRHRLLYLFSRYRTYRSLEKNSFFPGSKTKIISLSENQIIEYQSAWKTQSDRMFVVPPTVDSIRRCPEFRNNGIRQKMRSRLDLHSEAWVWLSIGVQPKTKGFDRTITALTQFPDANLLIVGLSNTDRVSESLAEEARKLGVESRLKWLGHREDIPQVMAAADLLIHPARYDTTGTVILEAVVNGLPVITTSTCGYSSHVEAADAGIVVKDPFEFSLFIAALAHAKALPVLQRWSVAGEHYGRDPTLYQGRTRAAEMIVEMCQHLHGNMAADRGTKLVHLADRPGRDRR